MLIESSEPKSLSCPQLPIDANQNQVVQNSHLTPWFWLMPDRSYNHSSYHLYFCWKLRMYCFVITFIFDETQGFPPKEGMSRKKLIPLGTRTQNHSYGPQSYTFSFILWGHECSRFVRSSLVNSRKNFLKITKTLNYPCQNIPPVLEIPPDRSTSRKKPQGV